MDTISLVENQITDGEQLLDRLTDDGVVIRAAYWVKPSEEDRWYLYIATPLVDQTGSATAYRKAFQVYRTLENPWITDSDIKLVGESHPTTKEVCDLLARHPGRTATRSRRPFLGGMPIEEVYIYPPVQAVDRRARLTDQQKQVLKDLYARTSLTADELAYTQDMERIHADFIQQTGLSMTVREVYSALMTLRKQGRLDRKLRA